MAKENPVATADLRSVHTDALGTIGMLIPEASGRDAIHLAVEPSIAGELLYPGQHIGYVSDGNGGLVASTKADTKLGIVDPFLVGPIYPGSRFWLVVYPRTITSLRHVWEHPGFSPAITEKIVEVEKEVIKEVVMSKQTSQAWIEANREQFDNLSYEDIMDAADAYQYGNYLVQGGRFEGWSVPEEFWQHYANIRGKALHQIETGTFFSCSC